MPRRPALALALLLWLPLAVPALQAGAAPGWRAGTGRENITPPAGLWMTGYANRDRPADGKLQDLWVKALAVSDPAGNRGVLLTLDLCGIARETTDRVAAELERRHGLPRAAVMTNVSHTHCAPALEGNLRGIRRLPPDGRERSLAYLKELEGKMVQAAETALATLAPAKIGWGHGTYHTAIALAEEAGIPRVLLTHHDPTRTDDALDLIHAALLAERTGRGGPEVIMAREGLCVEI